jgi:hypothetical protein
MKWLRVFLPLILVCLGFCVAADLVLASGADLVITSVSGPTKAFLNQTISITYEVTNQGDADSGAYQVGLYLSKDTTIDPAKDRLLKEINFPGGLAAGQSKKTTAKVTLPVGGLNGLYYYGGVVGSSSAASLEKVSIARFEAVNGTVTDYKTGLMWQQADDGTARTWDQAKTYCNGLVLGVHNDWALPRIDQLLTIVDYSRYQPAIHPAFDCRWDYYWSSSTSAYRGDYAWYVDFLGGYARWAGKPGPNYYYVRCVRGGPW